MADKCRVCHRYQKCKQLVDTAKETNNCLLALEALKLCPEAKGRGR